LPAKIEDFKEVLDVDFKDISKFASSLDTSFSRKNDNSVKMADKAIHYIYNKYENNDDAIELLNDIQELKADYNQIVADLSRIENWGMARENGQTFLVMLDTGLSEEIFNQFYRRR
jgi:glutamate mutase epsilon subunit